MKRLERLQQRRVLVAERGRYERWLAAFVPAILPVTAPRNSPEPLG